jgi:transcription antitermination factor NusG
MSGGESGAVLSNRQRKAIQKRNKARAVRMASVGPKEVERHQVTISRAVIEPENLRWYVLRCPPNKEESIVRVFDHAGIPAAIPTSPREKRCRGKLLKWRVANMPGYVLVGFPGRGEIPWYAVLRYGLIRSVVGFCGAPRQVPWTNTYMKDGAVKKGGVERLLPDFDAIRIGAAKFMRAMRAFEKGEGVRIEAGPFTGFQGRVSDVTETEATVLIELFGRQTPVQIPVGDAVKAEAA